MKVRHMIVAFAMVASACTALSQVSVLVWQENRPDHVVYHYCVTNSIDHPLLAVEIGIDQVRGGELQLTALPSGVVVDEELLTPDTIGFPIPAASFTAPAGWSARMIVEESEINGSLRFAVADTAVLRAGIHRGFSIAVPIADEAYRTGQWLAVMERGVMVWGALKPDETDAPAPTALVSGGGTACRGVGLPVSVALSGNGPWSLQWTDGQVQTASISPALRTVTPQVTTSYGLSSVSDVNRPGSVTGSANATILSPAGITTQPASKAVKKGSTTTLNVVATGASPLSYQWYKGATGTTTSPVGTNSPSFTTPKITAATAYWVRVTNGCGTTNSVTASITLQ